VERSERSSRPRAVRRNPENEDGPQPVGSVIRGLLGRGAMRQGVLIGRLGGRWTDVVGERLARETRPAALRDGGLTVEASTAAWAAQVRFLAEEIRRGANSVLGAEEVREVRVTVGGARQKPLGDKG
ncbi:MAG: DUF721 domain-containing protein, partial [Actinomycetota bacterium]|nr:DUF721 domain-containing protein [Actinomycetota bacterium]